MKLTDQTQTFTRRQLLILFAAGSTSLAAPTLVAKMFSGGNMTEDSRLLQRAGEVNRTGHAFVLSF